MFEERERDDACRQHVLLNRITGLSRLFPSFLVVPRLCRRHSFSVSRMIAVQTIPGGVCWPATMCRPAMCRPAMCRPVKFRLAKPTYAGDTASVTAFAFVWESNERAGEADMMFALPHAILSGM